MAKVQQQEFIKRIARVNSSLERGATANFNEMLIYLSNYIPLVVRPIHMQSFEIAYK